MIYYRKKNNEKSGKNEQTKNHSSPKEKSNTTTLNEDNRSVNKETVQNVTKTNTTATENIRDRKFSASPNKESTSRRMSSLPINSVGNFFDNSSFEKDRERFLQSARNVLRQWGISSVSDDINSYRNLRRNSDLSEENQAVSFNEEENCHKVSIFKLSFQKS